MAPRSRKGGCVMVVSAGSIPIYVRVGDGEEVRVASIEPDVNSERPDVIELRADIDRHTVARALRRCADALDPSGRP